LIKTQKETESKLIDEQLTKVKKAMDDTIEQKKIEKQELHNSTEE